MTRKPPKQLGVDMLRCFAILWSGIVWPWEPPERTWKRKRGCKDYATKQQLPRQIHRQKVPARQICRWHRAQAPNQTMHSSKNPSPDNNSEDSCGGISVAFVPFPLNSSISGETPGNFASMEHGAARHFCRLAPGQEVVEAPLPEKHRGHIVQQDLGRNGS